MNTMRRWPLIFMIVIVVAALSFWSSAFAQTPRRVLLAWAGGGGSYSLVHFTGKFFPPAGAPDISRTLRAFHVLVDGEKELVFVVEKARNLSAVETELGLLKGIFPPRLAFWGDKEALLQLKNPEIAGKSLLVRGYLYRGARRFHVLSLEPTIED